MDITWQDPTVNPWKQWDNNNTFDLISYQEKAREIYSAKRLFELWEDVCDKYDRGHIGSYALDEMKAVIWPRLHTLSHSNLFSA